MNLVFIHFGSRLPAHLRLNLDRTVAMFDNHSVFLVTDHYHKNLPDQVIQQEYKIDAESIDLMSRLNHPKTFRDNFWFLTLRRFMIFSEFMSDFPNPLVHIESDVLLSADFPFDRFDLIEEQFAFPLISDSQGIPSVFFIRDKQAARKLREFTILHSISSPNTTDMQVLHELNMTHPSDVFLLPSGPPSPDFYKKSINGQFHQVMKKGYEKFEGIIDGASIGQYIFGDDPRNFRGIRHLFTDSQHSTLLPSLMNFCFSSERNFVDCEYENSRIPIYALHIHSKDLRAFDPKIFPALAVRRLAKNSHKPVRQLIPKVFVRQAFKSLIQRFKGALRGTHE
jgi:hypothetical protein